MWRIARAVIAALTLTISAGAGPARAQEFEARVVSAMADYAARLGTDIRGAVVLPPEMAERTYTAYDEACLALAIYQEARGEPRVGQRLVAHTILNRVRSSAYPDSICGVVYQNAGHRNRCQFSFACDRKCDSPRNMQAARVAIRVAAKALADDEAGNNPFPEAFETVTHYHRFDVAPVWSKKLIPLGRVGDHVFFVSERVLRRMADGRQRLHLIWNFLTGTGDRKELPSDTEGENEQLLALAMLEPQTSSQAPLSPAR
jgi:spore germination cell wall hydrolase CwlJ-like protein